MVTKMVTRQELYEAVWRAPISKLATEWGVSSHSIFTACKRMSIPRPDSGHWSMVHQGWQLEREVLPPPGKDTPANAILKATVKRVRTPRAESSETKLPEVKVAGTLENAHPLVRKMRQLLRWEKENRRGVVEAAWRERPFNIAVAKANVERALKILDAVIQEVVSRGGRFQKTDEAEKQEMYLMVEDEPMILRVYEGRIRREITEADRKEHFFLTSDVWRLDVTGELRFKIEHPNLMFKERKWNDSERGRLEEKLGEIVETIFLCATEAKATRQHHEQERAAAAKALPQREIERRQAQRDEEFRSRLIQGANAWRQTQILREFVANCEAKLRAAVPEPPAESPEVKWIARARQHADQIDPLKNGWLEKEMKSGQDSAVT